MMNSSLSVEKQEQIYTMARNEPSISDREIARRLGVSRDAAAKYREKIPETRSESDVVSGDTRTISIPETRIKSLEELVEVCRIDLTEWEVERFVCNKWEVGAADKANGSLKGIVVQPLFQVKAFLRRKKHIVDARAEIEDLKQEAKRSAHTPLKSYAHLSNTGNMLEVALYDAHFGKLAWGSETMGPNYDLSITEAIYFRALDSLIERSKGYGYEKVLFVVGQDLLNSDNLEGRTTKGTHVSTDGRFHKMFKVARKVMVESIERLRRVAPVMVVVVPGNHDTLTTWCLGDSLECYFHKYSDVDVQNEPTPRKYVQFGNVLLMFTHGDKGKRIEYPLLMATEKPELFGATKFREVHTGHLHTTKVDEKHGVCVRILPSLSPADAWHAENGFVGNQRKAEAYVWNKDEGLIAQFFYNDDAFPEISTKRVLMERAA